MLELEKLGKVKRPRDGKLGSMLISFLYRGTVCRKLTPLVITKTGRRAVEIHTCLLRGGQFQVDPWLPRKQKRRKRANNDFQKARLVKVELQNLEPSTLALVADRLKKDFLGSGCSLIGLNLEVAGRKESWSTRELLDCEDYVGFAKAKASLVDVKSNGGRGIRFYEKLTLLYRIGLSSKLNLEPSAVDAVFESIEKELTHFN